MGRRVYIATLWLIWLGSTSFLIGNGAAYYELPLVERPHVQDHVMLKPGGVTGHGVGIVGSLMMIVGVAVYAVRKRSRRLVTWGNLRDWLALHIFLCVAGAMLVTFHTAFKFGGLVAVSYWCMVGVAFSGLLGRYVYVRIPRDIRGNELTATVLQSDYEATARQLRDQYALAPEVIREIDDLFGFDTSGQVTEHSRSILWMVREDVLRSLRRRRVRRLLRGRAKLSSDSVRDVMRLVRRRATLVRSIHFYATARRILHYWHVVHLPFTIVMFLILLIHSATAILFGYRWIF